MKKAPNIPILTLAACLSALSANAQIAVDLIGLWEFEDNLTETSGTHAELSPGVGLHDGSEIGTVAYVANPNTDFGQALDLDGSNGVSIDNSSNTAANYAPTFDADINTANAMSVSIWFNGSLERWNPVIAKYGETNTTPWSGWQVRRQDRNNNLTFTLRDTEGVDDPGADNQAAISSGWRHILAVWDGSGDGTRKIYIDGVEDTTLAANVGALDTSITGPGNAALQFLTIGARDNGLAGTAEYGNNFVGQIDDAAIWSRALTDVEARNLATSPLADVIAAPLDTDGDGLIDSLEVTLGTSITLTDSDSDGVGDFEEYQYGSDPTTDDDADTDGLLNSVETSGSANPWTGTVSGATPGDATAWNLADSDGDGIDDGDELSNANGFVTNPNDSDSDGDGWGDPIEIDAGADPTSALSVPPADTGLIGYWNFDDSDPDPVLTNYLADTSGAHAELSPGVGLHDGTEFGPNVTFVDNEFDGVDAGAGPFGTALSLSGSNSGISINNSEENETNYADTFDAGITNAMSVSFWKNNGASKWWPFISKHGEGSQGWQVRRHNSHADAAFTTRGLTATDDPHGDNTAATFAGWVHIVAVWDGTGTGTKKIYIDGVEDTAATLSAGPATGTIGDAAEFFLCIGMRDYLDGGVTPTFGYNYNGQIDDVAIWNRAILPSEIALLANNPLHIVLTNVDSDGDGLFDDDEINTWGTDHLVADTDLDGVDDGDEVNADPFSDPLVDNDYDVDGLLNSQETSGSANPWVAGVNVGTPGETTAWNNPDSDLDGILDGEEVIAGVDGFVTDPNNADTDGDGWTDGDEVNASTPTDPTNMVAIPTNDDWFQDLQGYWKLDGDLLDSGYLAQDGVMGGTAVQTETYVAGMFGQAVDLDVSNKDRVEITGNEDYFDANGSDVTVSIWMTADSFNTNWQGLFSKGEQSWRIARYDRTSGLGFAAGTVGDAPGQVLAEQNPILGDGWHHVVGVLEDGVGFSIYIDGYYIGNDPDAPNAGDVPLAVWIGGNPTNAKTWDGNVDDAAIWKRALTAEEIYTVFAEGMSGNDLQYIIDNNVTPVTEIPEPEVEKVLVDSVVVNASGDFEVTVSNLEVGHTYALYYSESLDPIDWQDPNLTTFTATEGSTTHTFIEAGAANSFAETFYAVFDVTP